MGGRYTEPISFRVELDVSVKLASYAQAEHRTVGDFVRELLGWGLSKYEEAGCLHHLWDHEPHSFRAFPQRKTVAK